MSESAGSFKEPTLTEREHIDPDKHWIGEALPAAGTTESKPSGSSTGPGTSPFPARADHTHDTKILQGAYTHGNVTLVHSQAWYFNAWQHAVGSNFLYGGANQLFVFPSPGLWQISMLLYIVASTTFNVGQWCQWFFSFNNATVEPTVYIGPIGNGAIGYLYMTAIHHAHYPTVSPATNFQVKIATYAGQNVQVGSGLLQITRLGSL